MRGPRAQLAALLDTTLHVRQGEGRRVGILFVYLLLASMVFMLGRTVRDTLFLSRYPIKYLPWMFVLYGIASSLTALVYGRYADKVPRHRMILTSVAVGIGTYLATWALVKTNQPWIYPAFYVWTEVVSNLFIVQFWTLANDLFDARAAKRLFGTIGASRMLGVVLVGVGAGVIVKAIGTAQLIFVLAAMMAGIGACALALQGESRADVGERSGLPPRRHGKPPDIWGDPYVRSLSLMILLIFIALTIGDYQFKRIARAAFQEDDLARFFSLFYAGAGTVAFLFQSIATPRLLAKFGVGAGMAVMPTIFGAAATALLFIPKLAVVTIQKFADNGFQYGIHETTLQALYVPFAPEVKAKTRAFLDAIVKPLSYGVGGLALVFLVPHMSVTQLCLVTVPIAVAWGAMIPVVKRRYLRRLEATLSARGALALDHDFLLDAGGRKALVGTLATGEPAQVLVALEQLAGERDEDVRRAVAGLGAHPNPEVRSAALYRLAHGGAGDGEQVAIARAGLSDSVPDVRAAAAAACATLAEDESVDELVPLMADPEPDVRVAALAGLLGHGGVEGGIVGGAELGRLLQGTRDDRIAAARALRHLGGGAYRPLRRLLADDDPAVRRAALKSAPGVADPRLVPVLFELLADAATRRGAGKALVAVGPRAVAPLGAALADPATPRPVRLLLPRLLRRIAVPDSYAALRAHTASPDSHLRLRVYAAMSVLRRRLHGPPEPLEFILPLVRGEIVETYRNQLAWTGARAIFGGELLEEEFAFRRQRAMRRILRALELRADPEALRLVREHMVDPARRANALEVLDTMLDPVLRPLVMPFVDEVPEAEQMRRAAALVKDVPEPTQFMTDMCRHPNPYVVVLALDALARHAPAAAGTEAGRLAHHPDPLVREAAAIVTAGTKEAGMYSTLEKVLLLKRAKILARISGEDLAALARVAEPQVYAAGEFILREGETADALYIIVRGRVGIIREGIQVAVLGADETLGEMAVLGRETRSASAVALEETETLWIGNEEFYEILHEQVEIAEGVIRMLSDRLRETTTELGKLKHAQAR